MYTILDNPKRMTKDEIRTAFANKWVFVVECDFSLSAPMKTGIPIVIADRAWEGREEGIYAKLKEQYGHTMHLSFLTNELNVFGFNEVVENE